ncbi:MULTISPECIES: type I TA system toxin YonT [Bacillus amyloliquefaciens group]|uniref:type I TA system toxin YonT n=1 Tax=Bacillus amyloliquefaciens group TaxID=1938374 RepID=UPI0035D5E00E
MCYNRVIGKEVYIVLEKVGITIAFLIPITVLIINCLTIAEKIQNLMKNKKSKKRTRKRLRSKRQRKRIRR